MTRSGRWETLGLAALSGVALALAYPPLHTLVLPFVGLVPLAVALMRCPDERLAFEAGGAFAVVHFGIVCSWVPMALAQVTGLAWFLFAAGLGLFAVLGGLAAVLFRRLAVSGVAPIWLALPLVWVGFEFSLAVLPGRLAYPWLGLGTALTGFPTLVGFAEFVGARGVSFWAAAVNGFVAALLLGRAPGAWPSRIVVAGLLVGPPTVGWWSTRALDPDVSAPVAVVRTDLSRAERLRSDAAEALIASAERAVAGIAQGSVALVVLPEGVLPMAVDGPDAQEPLRRLQALSTAVGAPVLFGASAGGPTPSNRAHLMEPRGLTDFRYDKQRLVPFVEGPVFGRGPSDAPPPLATLAEQRFGVLVCYESAFPERARRARRAGADILVNITNDAWSGGGDRRTAAYWQHPAHLVMRAIETRAGVVRAANQGLAFIVEPSGRVHDVLTEGEGHVAAVVSSVSAPTLYERTGDLVGFVTGAAFWLLLAAGSIMRIGPIRP